MKVFLTWENRMYEETNTAVITDQFEFFFVLFLYQEPTDIPSKKN